MTATVVVVRSSGKAVIYYERDGYYLKNDPEHRQASFWYGDAAKALGLRAHVHPSRFESVLSGYVPGTDLRLGRMREGQHEHRPGWDITLSAPKSVSLEALVMGDRRVIRAHDEAVRATLDFVEAELLQTRGWDPATRRRPRVSANGMVVAGFRHLASRDQDPQLHTHCVLANMTRTASGEWRSVEPTKIRRSQKLIGAYYRNELARRLQALGMAVAPRMVGPVPGFELAGYERSFIDAFSGRRRAILEYLEQKELSYTAENTQMAALHTRRRKEDRTLADLVPEWRARAQALGLVRERMALRPPRPLDPLTGERVRVPRVPAPDLPANEIRSQKRAPALPGLPRDGVAEGAEARLTGAGFRAPAELSLKPERGVLEAVARAVAHVAERRTAVPEAEIRAVALGHAPGRYTLAEVDAAIARLVRDGELIEVERRGMDRAFVTDRAVKAERRVLASMRAGCGKGMALAGADAVEARLEPSRLTRGQREAVRTVLLSNDLVIGVQGHAGSGKTTMLSEVKELLGERKIQGLAPSAVAARVLAREAGIPTRTLQYFLTRFGDLSDPARLARARAEYGGAVLAVDEASMTGSVRMEALLRVARALKVARVVLVGDTKQLKAVDAGQPFRLLQKAGMATATMKEVKRQRDPELRAAVGLAREGEPGAAIAELGNRVREAPPEELGLEAGRRWLALAPEHRADTLILAPTHAICRQANDTVREGLAEEGVLRGRTLAVDRLVNRRLTRVQASDIRSYEPGDTVVFHRDVYGCRANDVCIVMGHDDGRVVLAHPDGERRFRPSGNAARYLGLYDTERIELRAGDRIRWTRNRKAPLARGSHPQAPDLVNGGEAEIVEIGYKRVRFRDGEREFSIALTDPQLRHLDHAYCSTVHSAQGRTARGAIAVLDAGGWVDPELFHVELSRVSEAFLLLTDDREALIERLEAQDWSEDGALEALGIDLSEPPVVDPEEFAALAADWRALLREGEETNTLPFFLTGYRDVMARAAALAQIEDLPEDMRRLTGTMLAEHEGHLARDREVRGLVERVRDHWRRWPELGWAASAQGLPIEELPEHDTWREEVAALLEAGRARLGADGEAARHLQVHAGSARRPGRGRRDARAHAAPRQCRTLRTGVARASRRGRGDRRPGAACAGPPAGGGVGRKARGRRGARCGRVRLVVAEWRKIDSAQVALAEEVRTLPGRIAAWRERRADLPQDEPGGLDPDHPARRAWREEGGASWRPGPRTCCAGKTSTRPTWPPCRASARRWSRQRAASRARCSRSRRGRRTCCLLSCDGRRTSSAETGRRTSLRPGLSASIPSTFRGTKNSSTACKSYAPTLPSRNCPNENATRSTPSSNKTRARPKPSRTSTTISPRSNAAATTSRSSRIWHIRTDSSLRRCTPTTNGTTPQSASSRRGRPSPMTGKPTDPASNTTPAPGAASTPASASSARPWAATPPPSITGTPSFTSTPSPGPFPTHSRPWTPTRATAASATSGTRTSPWRRPAKPTPTTSRATPRSSTPCASYATCPISPQTLSRPSIPCSTTTPHSNRSDSTSTPVSTKPSTPWRSTSASRTPCKSLAHWTSALRTSRAMANGRTAPCAWPTPARPSSPTRNASASTSTTAPTTPGASVPASNASTTPSAATKPQSVANDTNPCPKTRRPQNAFHSAAASSCSARRNWHPATLDGLPGPPQLQQGP